MTGRLWVAIATLSLALLSFAPCADAQDREARMLFEAGSEAYNNGEFGRALEYFQRSYELSHRPQLLFNVAQAAERLRQDDVALRAYHQYLTELPEAPNRALVESRIRFLEEAVQQQANQNVTPTEPPPDETGPPPDPGTPTETETTPTTSGQAAADVPADAPAREPSILPYVVMGVGGAVAITGVIFFVVAGSERSTVEDAERGSRWEDVEGSASSAETFGILGAVSVGLGAAGIATGIVLMASGGSEDDTTVSLSPRGIQVHGHF